MPTNERNRTFLRRKSNDIGAQKRDSEEVFCDFEELPFRRTLGLLGFLGLMPFTWKKPHFPSQHPTKSTFLLSVVIYFILFATIYRAITTYLCVLLKEDLPPYVALTFSSYVVLCLFVVSSVAVILDVPDVQQALRLWSQLNARYREITNEVPAYNWQPTEKCLLFMILCIAPCCCILMKMAMPLLRMKYEDFLPIWHACTIIFSVSSLWIAYYSYLEVYAKDISRALYQNIQQGTITSEKLRLYQDTWVTMKKSSDAISSLNAPFLVFLISIVKIILSTFEFILFLQAGLYSAAILNIFFGLSVALLVSSMAKASDLAVGQFKDHYSVLLAQLNVDTMRLVPQYQILNMFLIENVRAVTPSYGGFVLVSKALIPSLFVAVTMNIVVLAQFTQPSSS